MAKPSIAIPNWARAFVLDPKKFASIETHAGNGWTYAGPKSDILWIGVPKDAVALLGFTEPPPARQYYLVFPFEYNAARNLGPFRPHIRTVYTSGLPAAVAYALGLLEKGAAYGVWGELDIS